MIFISAFIYMNPDTFNEVKVDQEPILAEAIPVKEHAENLQTTFRNKRRNIVIFISLFTSVMLYGIFHIQTPLPEVMLGDWAEPPNISDIDNKVAYGSFRVKGKQEYSSARCSSVY
jgi:hypothetical protein